MEKSVILFFGTFNPVHYGHLYIAGHVLEHKLADEVWFVVSPRSPFKENDVLLDPMERIKLVEKVLEGETKMKVCDVELRLPMPSYTINTLKKLIEEYPCYRFSLLMGEDNLLDFYRWKSYEEIINNYLIYVYPRNLKKEERTPIEHRNIIILNSNLIDFSATEIREIFRNNSNTAFVPDIVRDYWMNKK